MICLGFYMIILCFFTQCVVVVSFVIKNDLTLSKWNILFALCILIHFYYVLFIFALYVVFLLASLIRKTQTVAKMFINLFQIMAMNKFKRWTEHTINLFILKFIWCIHTTKLYWNL